MKNWLRIFLILGCFIGLTSLLHINAQNRASVIQTAALHDQNGQAVHSITSHQPGALQLALTVVLPAGETVMTLVDQDNASFSPGKITDIKPAQGITAAVDQQQQLVLTNDQDQSQTVELVVPVKVADPLLTAKLELELQVVDTTETFKLPKVAVTADDTNESTEESATTNDSNSNNNSNNSNSQSNSNAQSSSQTTVNQRSQSTKQRSRSTRSQASVASSSQSGTTDDEADAKAAPTTKISRTAAVTDPRDGLTETPIDIHRGQIQIGSWSSELEVGGPLLSDKKAKVTGPKQTNANDNTYWNNSYGDQYYYSYQQADQAKAYAVVFDQTPAEEDTIVVYYKNVGAYTTSAAIDKPDQTMGAILTISNIKYNQNVPAGTNGKDRYIDFSNNFYSGIVYNGIESFDLDVTFTNADGTSALNFLAPDEDKDHSSYFTFGSLNGNTTGEHEWAGTRSKTLKGKLAVDSLVKDHDNGWYEGIGIGVWEQGQPYNGDNEWGDFLGSTNYERGAVSFPMIGTTQEFKLKSESGFTWQSFSSGYVVPLEPLAPEKTVHRTDAFGVENNELHKAVIDRDSDDMDSFYYTIYQPTYSIPDESIAKPDRITLTDQLPAGMTVDAEDIVLRNTDGKPIQFEDGEDKDKYKGKVTVTADGLVTYELSDKEIETLTFDGRPFAFQMKVTFDSDFVGTFKNQATVKFDSGTNYTWENDTNEVVTHFERTPIDLTLKKMGDLPWDPNANVPLGKVTFTIVDSTGGIRIEKTTNQDGEFVLSDLDRSQTYTISEEVPAGYTARDPFTLAYNAANKRWEVTGDAAQVSISDDAQKQVITVTNEVERGNYLFEKIDGTTQKSLAGAEFIIKNADGQYLTFDASGQLTGVVDQRDRATQLTGNAAGAFAVTGLPHGQYQLIETKAPDGYTIGDPHDFTISDQEPNKPDQIENVPYSLPVTGGQGIVWFIVLGLILTLSSLAIWRTHPRGG
ncbi:SpaA isopeptide-forming pilin-related protein [Levilactobacillus sp. N40-8-2]|uniref:SpaA isopeptide-forming pilin-related protein n=1 Tax=Levilactobacillus muriae TaxID=3238987 RepID=UPI0038B406E8